MRRNVDGLTASTESAFQTYAREEAAHAVRRAIHELPSKFRQIIVLRDVSGLTIKEAAKSLNSNPQLIKTRLFRARRMLAKSSWTIWEAFSEQPLREGKGGRWPPAIARQHCGSP